MARLPAPEDYGVSIPRPSRGVVDVPVAMQHTTRQVPTEVKPDVYTGEALQQAGKMIFNEVERRTVEIEALKKQEQAKLDSLKAQDALTQIRQARFDLTMGDNGALKVQGGNVLSPTYLSGYKDQLDTKVTGIMANLSPTQQAMLKPHADNEVLGLQSDILRHSMGEADKYKEIVQKGNVDTIASIGASSWNDPAKFEQQQMLLDKQVEQTARERGITSDTPEGMNTISAMRRKVQSPMLVAAVVTALDNRDVKRARQIFDENSFSIDPDKKLILADQITKQEDAFSVQSGSADFLTNKVYPQQTTTRKLENVVLGKTGLAAAITTGESGGLGDTQAQIRGPVIQSGPMKGQQAVGPHQIMPSSAKQDAAEAGIPWDENLFYGDTRPGTPGRQYHDALQQAHLARLIKIFPRAEEIVAAYNTGEKNVIEAKKKFDAAMKLKSSGVDPVLPMGADPNDFSFLDFLPKPSETKPYVKKVMAEIKAQPDIVAPSKQDIEIEMAKRYPGRPDLAAEATKQVEHSIDLMKEGRKSEIEQTEEKLYGYMNQGKTFQEIPVELLSKLPMQNQDKMREVFAKHISGAPRDSNQGLLTNINSDPNYLARIPNAAWNGPVRTQLSEYDWNRFDKQRSARLGGDVKAAETVDSGAVHSLLTSRFDMLEIYPPKDKGTNRVWEAQINSAQGVLEQAVLDRQKRLGRQLTDVEMKQVVNDQFTHNIKFQNSFLGYPLPDWMPGGGVSVTNIMTMKFDDVPAEAVSTLKKKLKDGGIPAPTNTQILTLYKQLQLGMK